MGINRRFYVEPEEFNNDCINRLIDMFLAQDEAILIEKSGGTLMFSVPGKTGQCYLLFEFEEEVKLGQLLSEMEKFDTYGDLKDFLDKKYETN